MTSNKYIFSKSEMKVLVTDSKIKNIEKEANKGVVKGKFTGGVEEKLTNRNKRRRQLVRERVEKAINSLTWYAKTQPENQVKQVLSQENLEPMIRAILKSEKIAGTVAPDQQPFSDSRRLNIAIMLVSLGLDECRRQIGTEYFKLFTTDVLRIKMWNRALQIGLKKGLKAGKSS